MESKVDRVNALLNLPQAIQSVANSSWQKLLQAIQLQISERQHLVIAGSIMKDPIFVDVNHEELFSMGNKGNSNLLNASSSNSTFSINAGIEHMSIEAIEKREDVKFSHENPDLVQNNSDGNYEGSFFTKTLRKMRLQKQEKIRRTIEKVIADVTNGLSYSVDDFDSETSDEKISEKKIAYISSDASHVQNNSVKSTAKDSDDKKVHDKAMSLVVAEEAEPEGKSTTNSPLDALDIDTGNIACITEEKMNISNDVIHNPGDKNPNNSITKTEITAVSNISATMNSETKSVHNNKIKVADAGIKTDECKNANNIPTNVSADKQFCGSVDENVIFQCDTINPDGQSTLSVQHHLKSKFKNIGNSNICSAESVNLANDNKDHISSVGTSDQRIFNVLRQFRKPKCELKVESVCNESYNKLTNVSETESVFTVKCEDSSKCSPDTLINGSVKKRKREVEIVKFNRPIKKRGRKRKKQKLMDITATECEQECNQEFLVKDELKQRRTEGIIKRRSSRGNQHTDIADLYERNEIDAVEFDDSFHSDTDNLQPTEDQVENVGQIELSESGIARHFLEELADDMGEESCYQNKSDIDDDWEESTGYLKNHEAHISLKKSVKSDKLENYFADQDDDDDDDDNDDGNEEISEKPILDEDGSLLRDLNAILDAENDDNPFQCPDCEQVLSSRGNLKRHINTIHRGLRPFMCPECSASFSEKRSMELHIVNVHDKIRPYVCSDCGKSYSNKTSLATHIKSVHVGLKPYPCTECEPNRYFARLPCLKMHNERWHNPNRDPPSYIRDIIPRNYSCPICQSNFSSTNAVKKHVMFVHEKLKAFQCTICLSNFRDYGNLRRHHTAIHEGIKPYKCDECPTTFCDKWGLQKHKENIHMGVKKHICEVCHFPFSEKSNMLRHFATVHKGVKPFECKDCDTKYTQKASLKHHLASVHNKTIEEAVSEGQLTPNFDNPINENI